MRILLVEDNEMLARGIQNALTDQAHCVEWFSDGLDGRDYLRSESADVAIIDINLPGLNGLDIVRDARNRNNPIPILILTARSETHERVEGLDAGADDYLAKPFEMAELEARLRALTRRQASLSPVVETLGKLEFDRNLRQIRGPEGPLPLTRRELSLFECLFERQGQIIPGSVIADQVYGIGSDTDMNAIQLLVSRLRKRISGTSVTIHTARGLGYMLEEDQSQ